MIKADRAEIMWDAQKKNWRIRIQIGEEVVKRPSPAGKTGRDAADETLRSLAVQAARDDGYDLDPATVVIAR